MLKIAIVDDNRQCMADIGDMLGQYHNEQLSCHYFQDGHQLLQQQLSSYDIAFVDIEMPSINGIELVQKIISINKDILIFYITSHVSLVTKAINNHAFTFVPKPIVQKDLFMELDRAMRQLVYRNKTITLSCSGITHYINNCNICYIEVQGRQCTIHLDDGNSIMVRDRLIGIMELLDDKKFVRCHKSYIVNITKIIDVSSSQLTLCKYNTAIPVGRMYATSVRQMLNIYMGGVI